MREDNDGKVLLENFLKKDTITCFVFLAEEKGLLCSKSKDLVVRHDAISGCWTLGINFSKAHFSNWKLL